MSIRTSFARTVVCTSKPLLILAVAAASVSWAFAADRRIVFIAGPPSLSHNPGDHEHRADCLLFQKCLAGFPGVTTVVYGNGWPTVQKDGKAVDDDQALDGADAVVNCCDGDKHNPILEGDRLAALARVMGKGAGLGLIHWAV